MNGSAAFIKVLEKYKLRTPLPPEVRAEIVKSKRVTLRNILKKQGELTTGVRSSLFVYRAVRKSGIKISFKQGRMIASGLAAIFVCAICAGAWTVSRQLIVTPVHGRALVIYASGETTRTDARGESAPLNTGQFVERGDRIITGDKSAVIIQIGDSIMVRLQPKTELTMDTLLDSPETGLSLNSGSVLARITKLKAGNSFSVKTPTVVASVRGTAFSVSTGETDTVAVTEGTVAVKILKTGEELPVHEGSSLDIAEKIKERPVTEQERLEINRILRMEFTFIKEDNPPPDYNILAEQVRMIDTETDTAIQKLSANALPRTVEALKSRYGFINLITLYTGEQIRGVIVSRGAMVKIAVPGGYRSIPAGSIKNTSLEK